MSSYSPVPSSWVTDRATGVAVARVAYSSISLAVSAGSGPARPLTPGCAAHFRRGRRPGRHPRRHPPPPPPPPLPTLALREVHGSIDKLKDHSFRRSTETEAATETGVRHTPDIRTPAGLVAARERL